MAFILWRKKSLVAYLLRRLNLRFPGFFFILAILTVVDFVVPDIIPFADEIGFALMTALLGLWKNRGKAVPPDEAD